MWRRRTQVRYEDGTGGVIDLEVHIRCRGPSESRNGKIVVLNPTVYGNEVSRHTNSFRRRAVPWSKRKA